MHSATLRLVAGLCLAALMVVATACDVDVVVEADVDPDGRGTASVFVTLDEQAVGEIGDLAAVIDTDDLAAAGWNVATPRTVDDGGVELSATKQVTRAADWQTVLDEVAGPGVFTNVRVTGTDQFAENQRGLSFDVDLSAGPSLVFDAETTEMLGGAPLGRPLRQLSGGRPIDEAVTMTVRASIASSDDQTVSGEWQPRFNQRAPLSVRLVSTTTSTAALLFRWIAGALAALGLLAALLAIVRTVLERRAATLHTRRSEIDTAAAVDDPAAPADSSAPATFAQAIGDDSNTASGEPVRLVVIDPLTVLFQQSKPIETYLLPYVRHNRGSATDAAVIAAHRSVIAGAADTATMWQACGVDGEASEIDEVFCEMRWLRPGAMEFLAEFSDRRIPVAAITNDSAVWSNFVRTRDRLTAVWPWLVSSEEGMVKPDPAIFDRLGRMVDVPWSQCLYVDTDPGSLAVAQALGMRTTFFDPENIGPDAALGHPRVTSFDGFFRRRLA